MISVVYPLGKGSRAKDYEIRMSIRSLEKNVSGIKDIWVVGECPAWLNVNHIPAMDPFDVPDRNIMSKILKACDHPDITEDFLFMNDDHFILRPIDAHTLPYYYSEEMPSYIAKRGLDGYGNRVNNSYELLKSKGLQTKYYDIHTPIVYNKTKFKEIMSGLDWNKHHGYVLKSLYANNLPITGTQQKDNKGHLSENNSGIFSTLPRLRASTVRFLQDQFPVKSQYERE